jgi:hypothetical protein
MVAAKFFLEDVNDAAAKEPLIREETATAVRRGFLEAWGFQESELAQKVQHPGKTRLEGRKKSFWKRAFGHEARDVSNRRKRRQ